MSHITINIAAKCDKAGRTQNQDNFWVCPNLDNIKDTSGIGNDTDIELSTKGALLVVADGMGGMKSGEKASEFVVEGIKEKFSNIPETILNDDNAIMAFMREAIVHSDRLIKNFAKKHHESEGMGSTIVMMWLLGEKAYCGWCGDSRIYCYNPQNNLVRLSHDHSYVQSLVDEGKIPEEDAFDHPDGNIITRSLGDSGENVNPEFKVYTIHRRDVFLLCSDGLSGLLRDDKIEFILAENCTSSSDALKYLWAAGEHAQWSDNATIEVACITEGGALPTRKAIGYNVGSPKVDTSKSKQVKKDTNVLPNFWHNNKQYIVLICIVAVIALGIIWFFSRGGKSGNSINTFSVENTDNGSTTPSTNVGTDSNSSSTSPNNGNANNSNHSGSNNNSHNNNQNGNTQNGVNNGSANSSMNNGVNNNGGGIYNNNTGAGGNNSASGGSNSVNPNRIQEQLQQQQQQTSVSGEYMELLYKTHGSINMIHQFIRNAQSRRYFKSAEANSLGDFIENARNLNTLPDTAKLNREQKSMLDEINRTASNADAARKTYKVYDEVPQEQFDQWRDNKRQQKNQEQREKIDSNFNQGQYRTI